MFSLSDQFQHLEKLIDTEGDINWVNFVYMIRFCIKWSQLFNLTAIAKSVSRSTNDANRYFIQTSDMQEPNSLKSPSSRDAEVREGARLLLLGHLLRADRRPLQHRLRHQVWRWGARPTLPREGLPLRIAGRVAQQDSSHNYSLFCLTDLFVLSWDITSLNKRTMAQ